ncbi:MAG: ABC transporter substrate-binding protein [Candidatus Marithrix sp.]
MINKINFGILFLIIAIVAGVMIGKEMFYTDNNLYIALVGPMQNSNGKAMQQGVQMYLDQVNEQRGIGGKKFKLLQFDDQNQYKIAKEQALKIVDSKALAVIGHYDSKASIEASQIYKQYGIPAITGSATADQITKDNDWYFRVIFNNSDQGALLANYTKKILNFDKAYIFFDSDPYGKSLAKTFSETAKRIRLNIEHQWSFTEEGTSFEDSFNKMLNTLEKESEPGMLFLATHSNHAIKAIAGLRRLENKIPIIGPDALASSYFMQNLKKSYPQEKNYPGYYTEGIYMASPFVVDISGKKAQDFKHEFLKRNYSIGSIITSALYYDATMVAVNALQKLVDNEIGGDISIKEKRKHVRENLANFSKITNAIEGVTGEIYFDKNGDAIKMIPVAVFNKGKPISTLEQYQPLANLRNVDNLLLDMLQNKTIQVNGKFMTKANVVYVGVDFNSISALDSGNSTYTADFYIWFRYKSNDDANFSNINFSNIFNPSHDLSSKHLFLEKQSETYNTTTKTYRIKTQFKSNFDFHDYPLDNQVLTLELQHKNLTKDKLIYVVDVQGMRVHNADNSDFFAIGGWKMNKIAFFQTGQKSDSTLGMPELFNSQQRIEYSRFNVNIDIDRHVLSFIIKNLLPTIFIIILGYVVYYTTTFGLRMTLNINMILATSLFHLKLASSLSAIEYNVLIEYVFYMVYMMAILGIIAALIINHTEDRLSGHKESLEKMKDIGGIDGEEDESFVEDSSHKDKIEMEEEKINQNQRMIKNIILTGRIGYPIIILLTLAILSYGKL